MHDFVDSGQVREDSIGRPMRICLVCGKSQRGRGHTPTLSRLPANQRERKAGTHPPVVAREVRMLALMLDAVIDLPIDAIGWRVYIRSMDLRQAIPVPRDAGAPAIEEMERPTPTTADVSDLPHYSRPPAPVRARTAQATKGIADEHMREIANRAIADGWQMTRAGSHYKFSKASHTFILPATTGDHRAWKNAKATARRLGINVEGL